MNLCVYIYLLNCLSLLISQCEVTTNFHNTQRPSPLIRNKYTEKGKKGNRAVTSSSAILAHRNNPLHLRVESSISMGLTGHVSSSSGVHGSAQPFDQIAFAVRSDTVRETMTFCRLFALKPNTLCVFISLSRKIAVPLHPITKHV